MSAAISVAGQMSWEQAVEHARTAPDLAELSRLCYYDDPIEAAAERFAASEEWAAIRSLLDLTPGQKVLEIGAGRGVVSWAFADFGCETFALEPDPSALIGAGAIRRLCELTGRTITVIEDVGERLHLADASFDHVICRGVLHHVTDLGSVCGEAFRVLKPGGRFLAIKEHVADTAEALAAFLEGHPLHHLYGGEHAYPLATYRAAFAGAGFAVVREFGPHDHAVTSAPALTSADYRSQFAHAIGGRLGAGIGSAVSRADGLLGLYRRWLSYRDRSPGRLYSFLAAKPQ